MTDEDREKFDAIRMNLELTSHDLEEMRGSIHELRLSSEAQRDATKTLLATAEVLLAVSDRHESRIGKLEGRA